MNICVCGWYFYPEIYRVLKGINKKHPVFIVAHRKDKSLGKSGLAYKLRENVGLEWGAYDWYLKNEWDHKSDVLFMHDDVRIRPILREYSVLPAMILFDTIRKFAYDQVYIFKSKKEEIDNNAIHGRAFFCSRRFLEYLLKENNGFWYDKDNTGHTKGPTPEWCKHFNEADYRFRDFLKTVDKMKVGKAVVLPAFDCARRGKFEEEHNQGG